MQGYFIGVNVVREGEDKELMESLDSLLEEVGAVKVRKYELIGRVYAVIPESAAEELAWKGYSVEPENIFKALSQVPSSHPR